LLPTAALIQEPSPAGIYAKRDARLETDGLHHNAFRDAVAHATQIVKLFALNTILEMSADLSVDASRMQTSAISVSRLSIYAIVEKEKELVPPSEKVPVDYQKNPAPVEPAKPQEQAQPQPQPQEKPVELSQKAHKEAPAKEEAKKEKTEKKEPVAETKPVPTPAPVKEEEKPKQPTAEKTASCAKQCTDQCMAKDQTTVQALIVCLKTCKCEQPATEKLLQSKI
jgi:outer membrane biosynthesis protein TonB